MIIKVHKCLKMESLSYLSSKLSTVFSLSERKKLRSSNTMDIARMRANNILGNRRFKVAAPILWSNLQNHFKSITSTTTFFKCLKTTNISKNHSASKNHFSPFCSTPKSAFINFYPFIQTSRQKLNNNLLDSPAQLCHLQTLRHVNAIECWQDHLSRTCGACS